MTSEECTELMRRRKYNDILRGLSTEGITDDCSSATKAEVTSRYSGLAALRLGLFQQADRDIRQTIEFSQWPGAGDFIELGAVYWLQGKSALAVESWLAAEKCKYGDGAGNILPSLILYYAAVKLKDMELLARARTRIETRLDTGFAQNWPAPLGRFLLKRVDGARLRSDILELPKTRRADESCRADFYAAVLLIENSRETEAKERFASALAHTNQVTNTAEFVLSQREVDVL